MAALIDITLRDMAATDGIRAAVERWVARLEHYEPRIMRCEVTVDCPHKHHNKGRIFHIRLKITVPDRIIVVDREPEQDASHDDFYVALADAFRIAKRQIQDHARIRRGDVKLHAS